MLKKILLILTILVLVSFQPASAQTAETSNGGIPLTAVKEEVFKAKIIKVIDETTDVALNNFKNHVQTYKMIGVEGEMKNKLFTIEKSEFNVLGKDAYKKNDTFLVSRVEYNDGSQRFFVVDYVRDSSLYLLAFLFAAFVILIGRKKGFKALVSLGLSFVIILGFILPQIIQGGNPVIISVIGGLFILLLSIYLINGFKIFTHLAAVSISISLTVTVFLSYWFTEFTKLTGTTEENTTYVAQFFNGNLNTKGLLLAGFIIGTLGVLDDVIINQISVVEEFHKTDKKLGWQQLFQKGLKVGIDHIASIVNSLFLAYMGASLPLLLFFAADTKSALNSGQMLNIEIITVEIVRMLTGSIGLILAVPIATFIAAWYIAKSKDYQPSKHVSHSH